MLDLIFLSLCLFVNPISLLPYLPFVFPIQTVSIVGNESLPGMLDHLPHLPGLINWTIYITICTASVLIRPSWDQASFMWVCTDAQQKPAPAVKLWQPEWAWQGEAGKAQSHTAGECLGQILGVLVPSPVPHLSDPSLSREAVMMDASDQHAINKHL